MGISVGPYIFIEHFVNYGIKITAGHECVIHDAWLVEKYWNEIDESYTSSAVGI